MNRTKLLTIAVIGLLLINIGTLSFMIMQKPPRPPFGDRQSRNGEGPKMLIIERLHFNEAQQKQFELLIDEHRGKTHELNAESRELHKELYSLLSIDSVDLPKKELITQKIAENQKAIDELNFDHFKKIKAICLPEQKEYFNQLAEELSELFGSKRPPQR